MTDTFKPQCECGAPLKKVEYTGGYLNEDQFMADRRGDWYCSACQPRRYYWNKDVAAPPPAVSTAEPQAAETVAREDVQFLIDLAAQERVSAFERRTLVHIARQLSAARSIAPPAAVPKGKAARDTIYDVLPPSAMDWLTSSDPPGAASQDWRDGWDACRNRVYMAVREVAASASPAAPAAPAAPEPFQFCDCPQCDEKRAAPEAQAAGAVTEEQPVATPIDRPICHYTGTWCKYTGTACTCTQPGFVGEPPRWPAREFRAELDKHADLTEADKDALVAIAYAGFEHANQLQAARSAIAPQPAKETGE